MRYWIGVDKMLKPDAHVNVKFYEISNGGRKHSTPLSDVFRFMFSIDNNNFDCRMLFTEVTSIHPGDSKDNIGIKFLNYDGVKDKLLINKKVYIRESGIIGEGIIIDITE
jgi:hypothetical protein